MIDDKI